MNNHKLAPLALSDLARELGRIRRVAPDEQRQLLLEILLRLVNGAGALFAVKQDRQAYELGPRIVAAPVANWFVELDRQVAELANEALDQHRAATTRSESNTRAHLVVVPTALPGDALALVIECPDALLPPAIAITQLIAAMVVRPTAVSEVISLNRLSQSVSTATTTSAAAQHFLELLGADNSERLMFVAVKRTGKANLELLANSALAGTDPRNDLHHALRRLMTRVMHSKEQSLTFDGSDDSHNPEVSQIVGTLNTDHFVLVASSLEHANFEGATLLVSNADSSEADRLQPTLSQWLALLNLHESSGGRFTKFLANLRTHGKLLMMLALVATALLGFVPVTDRVRAEFELEPVTRRIISAPFEARLDEARVRPGDAVKRNELLVRLDGRDLKLEAQSLQAERNRLQQSATAKRAAGNLNAAQRTALEIQKIDAALALNQSRLAQLDIVSPLDGYVLEGDLENELGRRLRLGQSMLEIAPLDAMRAAIRIPVGDIARVNPGARVHLSLDALDRHIKGLELERIQPRARIVGKASVFVGEAILKNKEQSLRPGMTGSAIIEGEPITLGRYLFHRPWQALRQWWPW